QIWADNSARKRVASNSGIPFSPTTGLPTAPATHSSNNDALVTQTFKVDPNTFYMSLQHTNSISFGTHAVGIAGKIALPTANVANSQSSALRYVTGLDPTTEIQIAAENFFHSAGVDLDASKGESFFFNDRNGTLTIHGTPKDVEIAQAAIGTLIPPETNSQTDAALPKPAVPPPTPQPEIQTRTNAFSTFSLNVSDVSFKLAAASLEKGQMPEPASIRSEEFINAFDYRDPDAAPGVPVAFASERAAYPFAHNRELLRFSLKTAAAGRQAGRPL